MTEISITVIFDPVCPWCYIGKRRLEKAMAMRSDYSFKVNYVPYQLNPDMPDEGADRQGYLSAKFGGAEVARMAETSVQAAQEGLGLNMQLDKIKTTPNSAKAHILVQYLQHQEDSSEICDEFVESLFRAYFCEGKNIGDEAVLEELWQDVDMADLPKVKLLVSDPAYWEHISETQAAAEGAQLGGVPFTIIAEEYSLAGAQEPQAFVSLFDVAIQSKS